MILAIYRSILVIENQRYQMRFDEYSFSPRPHEDLTSSETVVGWRHYRVPDGYIPVDVPFGSRVVQMTRPAIPPTKVSKGLPEGVEERLAVFWSPYQAPGGLDAETIVWMAQRGDRGFRMASNAEAA